MKDVSSTEIERKNRLGAYREMVCPFLPPLLPSAVAALAELCHNALLRLFESPESYFTPDTVRQDFHKSGIFPTAIATFLNDCFHPDLQ